jgi:hypothetical protein
MSFLDSVKRGTLQQYKIWLDSNSWLRAEESRPGWKVGSAGSYAS